ncbi:MAG: hypothetical protein NVS2B4_21500 [Ramlibacter sp.]
MTTDTKPDALLRGGHLQGASESLLQSLASRLHRMRVGVTADPESARLEKIRAEMLAALQAGSENSFDLLADRIRFATDLESLWYLRSDLLTAVTQGAGAAAAQQALQGITSRFIGVLPVARSARTRRRK